MKAKILDLNGKEKGNIDLPKCFSSKIRKDIVLKVLENKKNFQPYGASPIAGKQHSASGKIIHRRHVWKSGYGRGMSRVPRKITLRRGSQFNWTAAEISSARGGRRPHPPKPISRINTSKINKKEMKIAFDSAISASVDKKYIVEKYSRINKEDLNSIPIIVESKITELKTKKFIETLNKIFKKKLVNIIIPKKNVRSGKGKLRGRKYKKNAGALLVLGKNEKTNVKVLDIKNVKNLSVQDLAKGGLGRLVIYTENAIKDLGERK